MRERTNGFAEVQETVSRYTPERTAEITGVPAASIIRAAELWGDLRQLGVTARTYDDVLAAAR